MCYYSNRCLPNTVEKKKHRFLKIPGKDILSSMINDTGKEDMEASRPNGFNLFHSSSFQLITWLETIHWGDQEESYPHQKPSLYLVPAAVLSEEVSDFATSLYKIVLRAAVCAVPLHSCSEPLSKLRCLPELTYTLQKDKHPITVELVDHPMWKRNPKSLWNFAWMKWRTLLT